MSRKRVKVTVVNRNPGSVVIQHYEDTPAQHIKGVSKKRKIPRVIDFRVEGSQSGIPHYGGNTHATIPGQKASLDLPDTIIYSNDGPSDLPEEDFNHEEPQTSTQKQTPNEYLLQWLSRSSDDYLKTMYEHHAPPPSSTCCICQKSTIEIYRCTSCLGSPSSCSACLVSAHARQPTHRVEKWIDDIWVQDSLSSLGLVFFLGHQGQPCEQSLGQSGTSIWVGDITGFTAVNVLYCSHPQHASKAQQLLASGIFPCSDITPRSGFTLSLLDQFNIFTTLGTTSAFKYYSVLARITKPGFPEDVPDRYRELFNTHRRYRHLVNSKRGGAMLQTHPTDTHPGDQAFQCSACPRPGFNFEWSEVIPRERPWFRMWMSFDGNFVSKRKAKKYNNDDVCLSDGLGYFPDVARYKDWTDRDPGAQRTEKPACDNHKAGNDQSVRWAGRDVNGIGAFTCASHSCFIPRGIVNFLKGERFVYGDYAFGSVVNYLTTLGPLDFGVTYDIWCHWVPNLLKRAEKLPSHVALPKTLDLVGGIPKWHQAGHEQSCYVRYSLNNTQYVGRREGEGCERTWAHVNQYSGSTSEMSPGTRLDALNNIAGDWNYEKLINLWDYFPAKFEEAERMYGQQHDVFMDLNASIPDEVTEDWETVSLDAKPDGKGKWTSPLVDPVLNGGTFQSVIQLERAKETPSSHVTSKRPGATKWLSDGLELEHNIRKLQDEQKELGSSGTPRQYNLLNDRRTALHSRVVVHREEREAFIPGTGDPDHPLRRIAGDKDPEYAELFLPSSFLPETLSAAGHASLGLLEKELRRARMNDELESAKRLLAAKALAIKYRNENLRGETAITRAEAGFRAHSKKIAQAQWRYNNSRNALLRLGAEKDDLEKYLELTKNDLKYLKSYLEESQGVGQGYKSIPWIWRSSAVPNVGEWQINALRSEWFRSRERYKRWQEQLVILKREMVMAIRDLQKRKEIWAWKACSGNPSPGMAVYARTKSKFFGELARRLLLKCQESIENDVVHLEWSAAWLEKNKADDLVTYLKETSWDLLGYNTNGPPKTPEGQHRPADERNSSGLQGTSRGKGKWPDERKKWRSLALRSEGRTIVRFPHFARTKPRKSADKTPGLIISERTPSNRDLTTRRELAASDESVQAVTRVHGQALFPSSSPSSNGKGCPKRKQVYVEIPVRSSSTKRER